MASIEGSGKSVRALRTVGRFSLYVSYVVVWVFIWGSAMMIAYGRNEMLKATVGGVFLLVPVVVISAILFFRRRTSSGGDSLFS